MGKSSRVVYEFLVRHFERHSYAPSQNEIAEALYYAPSTIRYHLHKLEAANLLEMQPGRGRSLRLKAGDTR